MKKILLIIFATIFSIGIVSAQNANRNGFFLELGVGGLVGNTPRSSLLITDNVVKYKCLSGAAADVGFGCRFRFKKHWAYEVKGEAQIPFANPIYSMTVRVLPVGFRYTSIELWRNYSLYAHANLGGSIIVNRGIYRTTRYSYGDYTCTFFENTDEFKLKKVQGAGDEGYGIAYSAGIGVNLTPHVYLEACYNGQAIFNSFGKNGIGTNNFGIIAFLVGYRF